MQQQGQKEMKLIFNDGRPDVIVPYSEQNIRQYSKVHAKTLKEIEIIENEQPVKKIEPVNMEQKITISQKDLDALVAQKIAERGESGTLPIEPKIPVKGSPRKTA